MTRRAEFHLQADGSNIGGVIFDISRHDGIVGGELYGKTSRELSGVELRFWIETIGEREILLAAECDRSDDPCWRAKAEREASMDRASEDEFEFLFVGSGA